MLKKCRDGLNCRVVECAKRCLLVLDNLESVLEASERAGSYRAGYADYAQLRAGPA